MNKIMALVLTALLSVFIISDCHSQDDTEGPELTTVSGKVVKIDAVNSAITIRLANDITFSVPLNTPVLSNAQNIRLSDVNIGQYATVEHYEDPSGKLIATKVTAENLVE